MKKSNGRVFILYLLFIVAIIVAASMLSSGPQAEEVEYSDILRHFQNENVKSGKVDQNNTLELILKNEDKYITYELKNLELFHRDLGELINYQIQENILESFDYEPATTFPWWVSFLPYLIVIGIMVAVWWMFISRATKGTGAGGGLAGRMNSFSKARTKLGADEKNKVYFSDVAGADEEKEELQEVVEFLKNPTKFSELGAKIPRVCCLSVRPEPEKPCSQKR